MITKSLITKTKSTLYASSYEQSESTTVLKRIAVSKQFLR